MPTVTAASGSRWDFALWSDAGQPLRRKSLSQPLWLMAGGYLAISLISLSRVPLIGTLRVTDLPITLSFEIMWRVGFAVAMGGICWTYLQLLESEIAEDQFQKLVRAAISFHLIAGLALPLTSSDLFTNLVYGHLIHMGFDSYQVGPVVLPEGDVFRALVPTHYMPGRNSYGAVITFINWVATAAGSVWGAIAIHKLFSVAFALACVALARSYCIAHLSGASRSRAFLLFPLNPIFVWEISGQSHNDGVMVLALTAGIVLATNGRAWPALTAMIVGVVSKMVVVPVVGLYLWHTLRSAPKRAMAMSFTLIGFAIGLWLLQADAISRVIGASFNQNVTAYRISNSLGWFVHSAFAWAGEAAQVSAFRAFGIVTGLIMLAAALRAMVRTRNLEDVWRESLFFLLVVLLLAPHFQPWYLTWVLPLAMVSPGGRVAQFVALFSIVFVAQYPITGREIGSITIVFLCVVFTRNVLLPMWRSGPHNGAEHPA